MNQSIISIKKQVAENKLDQAFAGLEKIIHSSSIHFNDFIMLKNSYWNLKQNKFRELDSKENLQIAGQKLLVNILGFLDLLQDNDLILGNNPKKIDQEQELIYEKILVVCSTEREKDMGRFFSKYYFQNIQFEISQNIPDSVNDYQVILFDYQNPNKHSKELLEKYLEETNPYLIFFGEKFPFYPKYKNRVYFANSIFSLYARIKEMLDFLKYINPK